MGHNWATVHGQYDTAITSNPYKSLKIDVI
jgi:hypothetical protein